MNLKLFLQSSITPICVIAPDLCILEFNRPFLDMIRMRPRMVANRRLDETLHFEGVDVREIVRDAIRRKAGGSTLLREVRAKTERGESLSLTLSLTPVLYGDGEHEYTVCSIQDNTAEERTQEKYRNHLFLLQKAKQASAEEAVKLSQLFAVSKELASILELDPLIDRFMRVAVHVLEADACSLALWPEEKEGPPRLGRLMGFEGDPAPDEEVRKREEAIWSRLRATGAESLRFGGDEPAAIGLPGVAPGEGRWVLGASLMAQGRSIGAIVVHKFGAEGRFFPKDLELLQTIGNQVAVSVENAALYERLKARERELEENNLFLEERVAERTREIELEKEKLDSILTNMGDGALAVGPGHEIVFYNRAIEELCRGRNGYFDLFPREANPEHPGGHPLDEILSGAAALKRYMEKDGEGRVYAVSAAPLRNLNGELWAVALLQDVTDRREMEERLAQAEKLGALGELISGVAHELNNPLAAVIGFSELILHKGLDDSTLDFAKKIFDQSRRCKKIIENLLTFARKRRPERVPLQVLEVIDSVLELKAYELRVDNIRVEKQIQEGLPWILGDFHQLQQVFFNLINNAHQAMSEARGRGVLRIEAARRGETVTVAVADDGPGVPPAIRKKVFDPFFTTKDTGKGTGLGLSLSFGILKEHGGAIRLEESGSEGEGARFLVDLPVFRGSLQKKEDESGRDAKRTKGRILAIDDERPMVELYRESLSALGHRAVAVTDAERALDLLREDPQFDLILCDLKMPGMDGKKFYRALEASAPELCRKTRFVSGDADNRRYQSFLHELGKAVLDKPFTLRDLSDFLKEALDGERG